ncbi:hypothetical protein KUTeg_002457 [Tegillarca granosa]|uniref:Uncharacterized protein n=1 Tax=Tegillarca granosa TaxID=220873 RepID=A0ABQ9FUG7_TEGGR|nr:hypothetical protein KUTeg_002457 [Tegillarca granosa]
MKSIYIPKPPTTMLMFNHHLYICSNSSSSDDLTNQELSDISSKILGNMSDVLNNIVTGVSLAEPPADPSSQEWANQPNKAPYTVIIPAHSMRFNPAPTPLHENVAFSTQPKIQVLDEQGRVITKLGTAANPWIITASLRAGTGSNPSASLEGNLTAQFVNGWANFSSLMITHFGSGYIIDFNVTSPTEGENFTISTDPLTIPSQPVKASVVNMPTDIIVGNFHTFTLELQDGLSSLVLPDIAWRGHTWTVTAELGMPSLYGNVTFSGGSQVSFDTVTSRSSFYSITLSQLGMYVIKFHITSSPPDYDFYEEVVVTVKSAEQASMFIEESKTMTVKFDADYKTVVESDDKYFGAMVGNYFANLYPEILFSSVSVSPGSILVTLTISGNSTNINSTVYAVCSGIQSGTSFTYNSVTLSLTSYMTVGGVSYYGVTCGDITVSGC